MINFCQKIPPAQINMPLQGKRRTRSGCWTCRKRKKKCDSETFPCNACVRLGLVCDTETRLVWECDARRAGMKRRGPQRLQETQFSTLRLTDIRLSEPLSDGGEKWTREDSQFQGTEFLQIETTNQSQAAMTERQNIRGQKILPTNFTTNESVLLDHYIQRFSRTYPTCSDSTNPFLSILLPLAMQNRVVLDALLALSGAQIWQGRDSAIKETILRLRHRALFGCQKLLTQSGLMALMGTAKTNQGLLGAMSGDEIFVPLACCILLLLYEKLAGYGKANWMPHLKFLAQLFGRLFEPANSGVLNSLLRKCRQHQLFQFLHNLFLYNDLVQSTAGGTSTLSDYYLRIQIDTHSLDDTLGSNYSPSLLPARPQRQYTNGRFYYPYLIAEIGTGQKIINDADIDVWDGRLDWLPSFSTTTIRLSDPNPSRQFLSKTETLGELDGYIDDKEERIISYIYRNTAKVYLRQASRQRTSQEETTNHEMTATTLACKAVQHIALLREGSGLENALLWPIGIIARELTKECTSEREYILGRLQGLETRFRMEHFRRMQEVLMATWIRNDRLFMGVEAGVEEDIFLFG